MEPGSQSSSGRINDASATPHVHEHSSQSERTGRVVNDAEPTLDDASEVSALSKDQPRNGTRPVLSSWERKRISCNKGSSSPHHADSAATGLDPRDDLRVSTVADGGEGYISQEPDRHDCFRYEVEGMTLLLAWAEVAESIPPVEGTFGFQRVMGISCEESIPLNQSRSLGASLGFKEGEESSAIRFVSNGVLDSQYQPVRSQPDRRLPTSRGSQALGRYGGSGARRVGRGRRSICVRAKAWQIPPRALLRARLSL